MSIVIIFNNKDPKPWAEILQKKLPNTSVEIYSEVKDTTKIDFALCWKPEKNILNEFPNIKVVQSVGASVDGILTTQNLTDNQILTRIVDEQLSIDMFEFLLAGITGFMKKIPNYFLDQKNKVWQQKSYKTISKTTVTILGLGEIGTYVAQKISALGFSTKGWSKSEKKITNVISFCGENELKEALNGTDILINILPLTAETENILSSNNLKQLNEGACLINVGRGEHLVEADLIELLDNGYLAHAILDVFRVEPLPQEHPFWKHDKISVTPHIASITNVDSASDIVVANYKKFKNKEPLLNKVSLKKGY
jgi:glyoxylate/hydroxypyruvate reductase